MDRIEGLAKLTGAEQYVDDVPLGDFLWGMTVRSPVPRGRVREVCLGGDVDWSEVVVVDHHDLPGPNVVRMIEDDMPILAGEYTRYRHEAVVLVAHRSRDVARRAAAAVEIVVDADEPALDFRVPPTPEQQQHGDDNVLTRLEITKGDVDAALAAAATVIEGVYETGAQEHLYLETQGMIARVEDGVLVIQGSMQCPYYIQRALLHALGRDAAAVRVVQTATGGGFGGKEDYPSILALHVALLALKSGQTVKMVYDRAEDMVATTKRHPSRVMHRSGVDSDGRLLAQDIEVLLDAGAYVTLSPVVLSRGIIHAGGPYSCDNVRIVGKAIMTNTGPYGAFRGFGAPQTQFAGERHMDVIAHRLGHDPVELRRRNLLRDGDETSTGQVINDGSDREGVLDAALSTARYRQRQREHAAHNDAHPYLRRGVGLATIYHGAGFTGAGEVHLASRARVAALPDGKVEVLTANTEMGQGTITIFTQIVAGRLGMDPGDVVVAAPDTHRVPDSGPTVASRTVMVVGRLVERACDELASRLGAETGTIREAILAWYEHNPDAGAGSLIAEAVYEPPPGVHWDEQTYRGDAYGSFAWATYIAEVEVDLRTYATRALEFVAAQEVGTVLNPTLARGQIQGGVAQGIGWALLEDCVMEGGEMVNHQLTDYAIPTTEDIPPIRVVFHENPYVHGGGGAKGIGELPMDGPAAAITNAVAAAVGVEPTSVPLTPERLMELIDGE